MKNIVTVSIHFSFKGERYTPSVTIELDEHIKLTGSLPMFYPLIARENNYDMYSYEYEMMQAEELHFSNARGLVSEYITDNRLDTEAFLNAWKKKDTLIQLEEIAKENMGINHLAEHPKLSKTLLKVFDLGQKSQK